MNSRLFHSITSSARSIIDGGTASPSALAVLRFTIISNLVGSIATGDQAIFVRRDDFERIGGFPDIPLMEDIALSRALGRLSPPACISIPVITSARRWQRHGVLRTILLMWRLRFAYSRGADPADLAISYGYARHDE